MEIICVLMLASKRVNKSHVYSSLPSGIERILLVVVDTSMISCKLTEVIYFSLFPLAVWKDAKWRPWT